MFNINNKEESSRSRNFNEEVKFVNLTIADPIKLMVASIDSYNENGLQRDLDQAIVHGRAAALKRAYSRLSMAAPGVAANNAEDLAQTVAMVLCRRIEEVALRLKEIKDQKGRVKSLAKLNSLMVKSAIRDSLSGPKMVQMEEDSYRSIADQSPGAWTVASISPAESLVKLDSFQSALECVDRHWSSRKAGSRAGGWSPSSEMTGHTDTKDRPCTSILPRRSCQRLLKESKEAVRSKRRGSRGDIDPSL